MIGAMSVASSICVAAAGHATGHRDHMSRLMSANEMLIRAAVLLVCSGFDPGACPHVGSLLLVVCVLCTTTYIYRKIFFSIS